MSGEYKLILKMPKKTSKFKKTAKPKRSSKKPSKKDLQLRAKQIDAIYADFKKKLAELEKKHIKEFDAFARRIEKKEIERIKKTIE